MKRSLTDTLRDIFRRAAASHKAGGFRGARAQYSAIDRDAKLRSQLTVETKGEDWQLRGYRRVQMLALMRDNFRNAPEARALVEQRALNIVGPCGGTLQLTTSDEAFNAAASAVFASWARRAEFTQGLPLNEALRRIQISLDIGGDCVVIVDTPDRASGAEAPFTGSGRIRVFDADEIGPLSESDFAPLKASGLSQSEGLIYDAFGRHVGVIVSTTERGKSVFRKDASMVLLRDPDSPIPSNWTYLQSGWRCNQGRGVTPFATIAATLSQIESITQSETAAAHLNSQMLGSYVRTDDRRRDEEEALPDNFRPIEVTESGTAIDETGETVPSEELEDALLTDEALAEEAKPEFPDELMRANGVFWDVLPEGWEGKLYDTKRPNANVAAFIDFLTGRAAAALSVGKQYITCDPQQSYSAFRGSQVLTWPSFLKGQKDLERNLCDWLARVVLGEAMLAGILRPPAVGNDLGASLFWSWPKMAEANALDAANVEKTRLSTGSLTYREMFGPSWRERLAEIADEVEASRALGIAHPMTVTVAGAVVPAPNDKGNPDE